MMVHVCKTGGYDGEDSEIEAVFALEADAEEWVRLKNAADPICYAHAEPMELRAALTPEERSELQAKAAERTEKDRAYRDNIERDRREAEDRERSANEWQTMAFESSVMQRMIRADRQACSIDIQSWFDTIPVRYRTAVFAIINRVGPAFVGRALTDAAVHAFTAELFAAIRREVPPTPMPLEPSPMRMTVDANIPHGVVVSSWLQPAEDGE